MRKATAPLKLKSFTKMLDVLIKSLLRRFAEVKARQPGGGGYWQFVLGTDDVSAFLLESSLKDGMFREWGNEFPFV